MFLYYIINNHIFVISFDTHININNLHVITTHDIIPLEVTKGGYMKTITINSRKGGTGKTSTAISIAAGLRRRGFTVLMVDLDSQANLTFTAGLSLQETDTVFELLTGKIDAKQAIQETKNGDIIPASPFLSGIDKQLKKETTLKDALRPIEAYYDFCLADTPSQLGSVTMNALTASAGVIIPLQADAYSLQSLPLVFEVIDTVRDYTNKKLKVEGLLVTRYNGRAILSRDMLDNLQKAAKHYHTRLFDTQIRECTAIKEAEAMQSNIFDYMPKSNGAADYNAFIDEFLTYIK